MDDRQAIARLKAGHIDGLDALVVRYQVQALRAAYLITRDRRLAEDLVQEAFIRVFERAHQFDDARPFGPWFLRIVANDAVKAVTRRPTHVSLDTPNSNGHASPADSLRSTIAGPEEQAIDTETGEHVWEALALLSPNQRAVIVLRYYVGLTEAEAAREMGTSLGTVKRRMYDAKARLKRLLGASAAE